MKCRSKQDPSWYFVVSREQLRATYRVQLHKEFTLDDAAGLVDYLADLGISHLYCSPYLQARSGSQHGYDVVDHGRINEELGGSAALDRLIAALEERGMSHILDVVPNHMTISERTNEWWWDVLKNGPYSDYAPFFDIDWAPSEDRLKRKILIPVLGDHYGRVLDKGEIKVGHEEGEVVVRYYDHVLPVAPDSLDSGLDRLNEDAEALHSLLELQHYRLAYWRTAGKELNYRRFFAISDLAALRVDYPGVFERVHRLVIEMIRSGRLQGLRIDHIDGLRYPSRYLTRLRGEISDVYLIVEKILEPNEELPSRWPVEGTTGYDFLTRTNELFVDPNGEEPFTDFYEHFTGETVDLEAERKAKKLQMIDTEFGGELERLTDLFVAVCERERQYRDYTRSELRAALRETTASFPVYRTYFDPQFPPLEQDARQVHEAIAAALAARPDLDVDLFELLAQILTLQIEGAEAEALAVRFQQTTGPVVAKGVEDTLFYTFNRFVSLNEVGGDPGRFGTSLREWHEMNRSAEENWPLSMLASSTHDTKRSEDVRARLNLLSEIPDRWIDAVQRWSTMNERHKRDGQPDRNAEYLLYQTLVGAWPLDATRAIAFMQKAIREAKVHTSWLAQQPRYERAIQDFITRVTADSDFQDDLKRFVEPLIDPGRITSLSQTLLKITAPGVPDFYQGCESWDLSLVDPDNRRPVDYRERRALLERAKDADAGSAWEHRDSGLAKLWLIRKALGVRTDHPEAFARGTTYEEVLATGEKADHLIAFVRGGAVLTVAPRLVMGIANSEGWGDTHLSLPAGTWNDRLGGHERRGTVAVADLLADFPMALLERDGSP